MNQVGILDGLPHHPKSKPFSHSFLFRIPTFFLVYLAFFFSLAEHFLCLRIFFLGLICPPPSLLLLLLLLLHGLSATVIITNLNTVSKTPSYCKIKILSLFRYIDRKKRGRGLLGSVGIWRKTILLSVHTSFHV